MHHTRISAAFIALLFISIVLTFTLLAGSAAYSKTLETHNAADSTKAIQAASGEPLPGVHSAVSNSGSLRLGSATAWHEALLLKTQMRLDVQGLLAELNIEQQFTNDTVEWLEGSYVFPLPADAAIRGVTVMIGERIIRGQIMEREAAKKTYNAARDMGQVASLVEQQRPNLFTVNIATIPPGESVIVKLDVMLPVNFQNGRFFLLLPTTHTPRYTNTDTADAMAISAPVAPAHLIRGPSMSLKATISTLTDLQLVDSASHTLQRSNQSISIVDTSMDRDISLSWPAPAHDSPVGKFYTSEHLGKRYLQYLLSPPTDQPILADTPVRELILVIDRSGSMAGQSIRAARQALQISLDGLGEDDFFNVIAFDDEVDRLFSDAKRASVENIKYARAFVRRLHADGGTEMRPALSTALDAENADRLRQIVFITDGSVGYEDVLLRDIQRKLGNSRLFTIGIGTAPNHYFLRKAAEIGRGISLSITDTNEVQTAISTLLDKLEHPVLTDLSIQFNGGSGELYPNPVPDLYADQPLMITAQLDGAVTGITMLGYSAGTRWSETLDLPAQLDSHRVNDPLTAHESDTSTGALPLFWARQKIESLSDAQRFSVNPEKHRAQITSLALEIGLVSAYTSYVAVDVTPVRALNDPWQTTRVASLMPAGNVMQAVVMPMGASGSDTLVWWSALFASLGFLTWRLSLWLMVRQPQ